MERTELVEHLIEQHNGHPSLRASAFDRGALESSHWVSHQRGVGRAGFELQHDHGQPEPSCPPPQLVE